MTRRMTLTQLIAGAVIVCTAAIVVVLAVVHDQDVKGAPQADPELRPLCTPENSWLPHTGWPDWDVCGDAHGFHTCWRPSGHGGRHCAWNLATGQVEAVWPCVQHRHLTRWGR